jgi:hypothetical protein
MVKENKLRQCSKEKKDVVKENVNYVGYAGYFFKIFFLIFVLLFSRLTIIKN